MTELFDEYVRRREAGERPDVEALLQRAGDRAPELGERIDAYLVSAPAPAPSPELIAAMGAWMEGEPTLLAVRTGRRARRADVVEHLRSLLGLPENARERLAENYHRLETGLLDVSRIDERLRSALGPCWAPACGPPAVGPARAGGGGDDAAPLRPDGRTHSRRRVLAGPPGSNRRPRWTACSGIS
ncbi:MAG: hypothetical protein U0237_19770 [Thermoleophilia bacterium]